ncbi:hypothetical protein [uncultured Cohaesibacter sp.]|uniref:hypothetical protein n=1 Tax=uncultured Cohaesibacter sp. TaxID=1002546 RepID=UPI0029C6BF91|nr:hypothetical protein [uncultured Cohaesibacter sp.]
MSDQPLHTASALEGKRLIEAFFHGDLDACMRMLIDEAQKRNYSFSEETRRLSRDSLFAGAQDGQSATDAC